MPSVFIGKNSYVHLSFFISSPHTDLLCMRLSQKLLCCIISWVFFKKNRVNDYIKNGLHKKVLDPDGGANLAKKRLEFGLTEELHPLVNEKFPSTGFECGTVNLPRISYRNIYLEVLDRGCRTKTATVYRKPIVKGYNFFKSGHVLKIFSKKEHNKHYALSKVQPSMKNGKVYTVKIILFSNGNITTAFCCCPAGVDGCCTHLAATLFSLEDKNSMDNGMTAAEAISKTPENIPCTSSVPHEMFLQENTSLNHNQSSL